MKLKDLKLDWPNHLIGFFSALFGILIAFELEDWREHRNNQKEALEAFSKLKEEININKNALHETVASNQKLLSLIELELLPYLNNNLSFKGDLATAKEINKKCLGIAHIEFTDSAAQEVVAPVNIFMNSLLQPPLHYSAWESAKATGVINHIEYDKVLTISYLYNNTKITDELKELSLLLRRADETKTKSGLIKLISELNEGYKVIELEMSSFDTFASILEGMEL